MNKNSIIAAALIAVGIIVMGFAIGSSISQIANRDRVVAVRGLCEREVAADKVTWPLVTKEVGNELAPIYNKIEADNAAILAFLRQNGVADAEISVNPPQVYDQASERYSSDNVRYRYQVTNVIVVTSSKVEQVRKIINRQTELLAKGIALVAGDYNYQTSYEFTALNDIKPDMIREATVNAHKAAEEFAANSGSKVGKIRNAQQGQFSIDNRDQYTPNIKTVRVVTSVSYYVEN